MEKGDGGVGHRFASGWGKANAPPAFCYGNPSQGEFLTVFLGMVGGTNPHGRLRLPGLALRWKMGGGKEGGRNRVIWVFFPPVHGYTVFRFKLALEMVWRARCLGELVLKF